MHRELYCIVDRKAKDLVGPVITVRHEAEAVRLFCSLIAAKGETQVGQFPKDHTLMAIGKIELDNEIMLAGEFYIREVLTGEAALTLIAQES